MFDDSRFKLIPSVVSGPFIVRKAVGNKPALLGRKVSQRYFRGPGYVETDVGEQAEQALLDPPTRMFSNGAGRVRSLL